MKKVLKDIISSRDERVTTISKSV